MSSLAAAEIELDQVTISGDTEDAHVPFLGRLVMLPTSLVK